MFSHNCAKTHQSWLSWLSNCPCDDTKSLECQLGFGWRAGAQHFPQAFGPNRVFSKSSPCSLMCGWRRFVQRDNLSWALLWNDNSPACCGWSWSTICKEVNQCQIRQPLTASPEPPAQVPGVCRCHAANLLASGKRNITDCELRSCPFTDQRTVLN